MRFAAPQYTQIPNQLLDDLLPSLKEGEVRVLFVIMRQTFGWQKQWDQISLSQLEEKTGMQRKACHNSARSLEKKGVIWIRKEGEKGNEKVFYSLNVEQEQSSNNSYQYPKDTPPSILKIPTKETLTKESKNIPPNPLKGETSANASLSEEFSLNSSRNLIEDSSLVANSSNSGTYKSANLSYVVSEGDEADKLKRKVQEDSLNLANYLFERITLLKPDFKKPDLKKWGNDLRLAMEQDGRSLGSLKEVIESATQEIDQLQYYASAGSIRRNFDKLQVKSAVFKKETLKRRNKEFALQTKETHPANLQSLIITKDYACNKSNSKEIRLDLDQNTFRIRLLEIFNGTYTGEII